MPLLHVLFRLLLPNVNIFCRFSAAVLKRTLVKVPPAGRFLISYQFGVSGSTQTRREPKKTKIKPRISLNGLTGGAVTNGRRGPESSVEEQAPFYLYHQFSQSNAPPLPCQTLVPTLTTWHGRRGCLWHRGIIWRLWCRRLISSWPKLAEPPYQVSRRGRRNGANSRLVKRQRYHTVSAADGDAGHPLSAPAGF